jgi:crossover junction endodeoxyribonuclease RuvC
MENLYIGIDPGLDGAVAALSEGGDVLGIWDAPTLEVNGNGKTAKGNKKKKRLYLPAQMVQILKDLTAKGKARVCLELVHSMPKQGVASQFSLGHGVGLWEGIIAGLELPIVQVPPTKWKKIMLHGLAGDDKNASIVQALRLYPCAAEFLTLKKHDGRAEALLMAGYLRDQHKA